MFLVKPSTMFWFIVKNALAENWPKVVFRVLVLGAMYWGWDMIGRPDYKIFAMGGAFVTVAAFFVLPLGDGAINAMHRPKLRIARIIRISPIVPTPKSAASNSKDLN